MLPGESTPPRPSRTLPPPPPPPRILAAGRDSLRWRLRSRERDSLESRAYQLRPLALPYLRRSARGGPALGPAAAAVPDDAGSALPCRRRPWSALAMFSRTSRALREVVVAEEGTEAEAGDEDEAEAEPDDERAMLASLEKALLVRCGRPEVGRGRVAERESGSAMAGARARWRAGRGRRRLESPAGAGRKQHERCAGVRRRADLLIATSPSCARSLSSHTFGTFDRTLATVSELPFSTSSCSRAARCRGFLALLPAPR